MLMRGSWERRDEATVQKNKRKMGRSNGVRRKPVVLLDKLRTSQPAPAIAREISAAAIECGAKAE
jgi:hypothetical protein